MAEIQKFGIKFPLESTNEETFFDLNDSIIEEKQSEIIHLMLTLKGTKLRDPGFGCNLTEYIFDQSDSVTEDSMKDEVKRSVKKYIKDVELNDFTIFIDDDNPNRRVLSIDFTVNIGIFKKNKNVKVNI